MKYLALVILINLFNTTAYASCINIHKYNIFDVATKSDLIFIGERIPHSMNFTVEKIVKGPETLNNKTIEVLTRSSTTVSRPGLIRRKDNSYLVLASVKNKVEYHETKFRACSEIPRPTEIIEFFEKPYANLLITVFKWPYIYKYYLLGLLFTLALIYSLIRWRSKLTKQNILSCTKTVGKAYLITYLCLILPAQIFYLIESLPRIGSSPTKENTHMLEAYYDSYHGPMTRFPRKRIKICTKLRHDIEQYVTINNTPTKGHNMSAEAYKEMSHAYQELNNLYSNEWSECRTKFNEFVQKDYAVKATKHTLQTLTSPFLHAIGLLVSLIGLGIFKMTKHLLRKKHD